MMSNIIEKLMCLRATSYLEDHDIILCGQQFGFRPGYSNSDAVLQFVDEFSEAFDCTKYLIAILLDFSKAFDTVNHSLLLRKLEYYGFRGLILNWFRSFLLNRSSRVRVDSCFPGHCMYNIGVPQGSVLGFDAIYVIRYASSCFNFIS